MNTKKNNSFIDFFIEFIYLAIIFLMPIYFSVFFVTENPFELHKMTFFRSFLFLFIFLSLIKFFFQNDSKKVFLDLFKRYFYFPLIIIVFSLISILWSIVPQVSFYGTVVRQMGWLDEFYFFLFFIFLALNLVFSKNRNKKIKGLIITISLSSLVVSLYAIAQILGYDFLIWSEPALVTRRAMSSLGQANFLASFLLLTLPFSIYLASKSKNFYFRFFYSLVFLFQFLALISSGSRGAWIAFILSTFIFLFLAFFKNNKKKFFLGISSIIVLIFVLLFTNLSFAQRFQSAFNVEKGSSSARISIWSSSLKSLTQKDWGYGLENQREAIIDYYSPEWATFNKVNVIFDRSHNLFLDLLLTLGFVGLIFWLCFYVFIFKLLFKNIKTRRYPVLSIFIFWALGAYLLSLLFNFSSATSSVYFWALTALTVCLHYDFKGKVGDIDYNSGKKVLKILILALVLFSCLFGIRNEIKKLEADYYFAKTQEYFYRNEIPSASLTYSYLRETKPKQGDYHHAFVRMIFNNFNHFRDESSRFLAQKELEEILEDLENFRDKDNYFKHSLSKAQIMILSDDFNKAESILEKLKKRSPNYPDIYFTIAKKHFFQENYEKAIDGFDKTLELLPDNDEAEGEVNRVALQNYRYLIYREMANIYFDLADFDLAREYYFKAYNNNLKDILLLNDIAECYYQEENYSQAIFYNNHGIKKMPNTYTWYFSLGQIYYDLEEKETAFDYLKIAEKFSPNNLKIKNYLNKIKQ